MSIKRIIYSSLITIFLAVSNVCADNGVVGILIDGSGSMDGYLTTKALQHLVADIERSIGRRASLKKEVFVSNSRDEVVWFNYDTYQKATGNFTVLDLAYRQARKRGAYKILFFITDNIQSAPNSRKDALYEALKQSNAASIHIIPAVVPFDGSAYIDKRIRNMPGILTKEEIKEKLAANNIDAILEKIEILTDDYKVPYNGPKGILIYAVLLDKGYEEIFLSSLDNLNKGGRPSFKISPVTSNEIMLVGEKNPDKIAQLTQHGLDIKNRPNMYIETSEDKSTAALKEINEQNQAPFKLDRKSTLRFLFQLKSKYNNVVIRGTPDRSAPDLSIYDVKIGELNATALKDQTKDPVVSPPHLIGELTTQKENPSYYYGEIEIDPREISWWKAAFSWPRKEADLSFAVGLTISPRHFYLAPSISNSYFTTNPFMLQKIFSPEDIIQFLSEKQVTVKMNVASNWKVEMPLYPYIMVWSIIVILLFCACMVGRHILVMTFFYRIVGDQGETVSLFPYASHDVKRDAGSFKRTISKKLSLHLNEGWRGESGESVFNDLTYGDAVDIVFIDGSSYKIEILAREED